MKRSAIETLLGAFVLAVAGFFLVFSYQTANVGGMSGGYTLTADFPGIGGLKPGDDVTISGVKVGSVTAVDLQSDNYLARVYMDIDSGVKVPTDTAALISSESLLGGRYLALEPGAEDQMLSDNGHIQFTQAPQNLEQLLGKFIFSVSDKKGGGDAQAAPAPAPVMSPRVEDVPKKAEEEQKEQPKEETAPAAGDAPAEAAPQEQQAEPEAEPAHP
jgi:phospholipid/cholesterol/gamma-HCH transport system substrate-binding protein